MRKIKESELDKVISHPTTKREVEVRFLSKDDYEFYYRNGFEFLFEEVEEKQKTQRIDTGSVRGPRDFKFSETKETE